ncbi:uncharacterized protein LOC110979827 [Acanthaster planci]|uniref:Uncharacterized protein LOC110979827 n=1 Tax=Acanthaster planci TaxID=133434 RepID=A0A8B7YGU7_ACAPL|nr:uncharacterized protein LOC110979827 [Acanthaster planci]
MNKEGKVQGNRAESHLQGTDDAQHTYECSEADTETKRKEIKLNTGACCHTTNFAFNTLLLLQAAASLKQRDTAPGKTSNQCSLPRPVEKWLSNSEEERRQKLLGSSTEVAATVKSLAGDNPVPLEWSEVNLKTKQFQVTALSDSEQPSKIAKDVPSDPEITDVQGAPRPRTTVLPGRAITNSRSHNRVLVWNEKEKAYSSATTVAESCARTSPCIKTSKETLRQWTCRQSSLELSPVHQRTNLLALQTENGSVPRTNNSSPDMNQMTIRPSPGAAPSQSSSPQQRSSFSNFISASYANVKISPKSSSMSSSRPTCTPVFRHALDRKMGCPSLGDGNFQDGKFKTVALVDSVTNIASKQSPSLPCRKTVIVISPKGAASNMHNTSSSPTNPVMSPAAVNPERVRDHTVLMKSGVMKPGEQETRVLLHSQKRGGVAQFTPSPVTANTQSPSNGKLCPSPGSTFKSRGPGSQPTNLGPGLSNLNSPCVFWPSGGRIYTLVPVKILTKSRQSPVKQTLPRSFESGMNPTLCMMMKHFNYTMKNCDRLIDNHFLKKILSSDVRDIDDLFDDVELRERMQQHFVPDWLLQFIIESDAREKMGNQWKERVPSGKVDGDTSGKRNETTGSPKQYCMQQAGKMARATSAEGASVTQDVDDAAVLRHHAEDNRHAGACVCSDKSPDEVPNHNRNACSHVDKAPDERSSNLDESKRWNRDFSCGTSGVTGVNPLKTLSSRNQSPALPCQEQRNFQLSNSTLNNLGFLDLMPDRALWNLLFHLFPPWKKTCLGIDGNDVEEFFRRHVDLCTSHRKSTVTKRQRYKSGQHQSTAACPKTEVRDGEVDKRKRHKEKKTSVDRESSQCSEEALDARKRSKSKSKSANSRKGTPKKKHTHGDSYRKGTSPAQMELHAREKKKKHHKRKVNGEMKGPILEKKWHSSTEFPSEVRTSLKKKLSSSSSDDALGNKGRGQLEKTPEDRCKSTAEVPTCSKALPPKWNLKLILKTPRSKAKRSKKVK